ncbi:hypothetical protein ABT127_05790 [Streptomyces sp. NPDC001904]|uniref:hypothetical protein n=1 Tax=Streptomyces sp. NPDC001904 TaxID=3154531 RepID=UPI00332D4BB8
MTPEERNGLLREFRRYIDTATGAHENPMQAETRAVFATSAVAVSLLLAADSMAELASKLPPPQEG